MKKYCEGCKFKDDCGIYVSLMDGTINDIVNCPNKEIMEFENAKEEIIKPLKAIIIKILNRLERFISWMKNKKNI